MFARGTFFLFLFLLFAMSAGDSPETHCFVQREKFDFAGTQNCASCGGYFQEDQNCYYSYPYNTLRQNRLYCIDGCQWFNDYCTEECCWDTHAEQPELAPPFDENCFPLQCWRSELKSWTVAPCEMGLTVHAGWQIGKISNEFNRRRSKQCNVQEFAKQNSLTSVWHVDCSAMWGDVKFFSSCDDRIMTVAIWMEDKKGIFAHYYVDPHEQEIGPTSDNCLIEEKLRIMIWLVPTLILVLLLCCCYFCHWRRDHQNRTAALDTESQTESKSSSLQRSLKEGNDDDNRKREREKEKYDTQIPNDKDDDDDDGNKNQKNIDDSSRVQNDGSILQSMVVNQETAMMEEDDEKKMKKQSKKKKEKKKKHKDTTNAEISSANDEENTNDDAAHIIDNVNDTFETKPPSSKKKKKRWSIAKDETHDGGDDDEDEEEDRTEMKNKKKEKKHKNSTSDDINNDNNNNDDKIRFTNHKKKKKEKSNITNHIQDGHTSTKEEDTAIEASPV
eukprot:CAMPEP_0170879634 /NCGR_PEP_ID=MMETSP0734-20130129/31865_1 /TAXON_ID=186038 /ORGANISM="Fragilariopsis kerguelensis, Strain L26-C5" /LENGTH=500 /DNA_ID=CAMNT_0011262821 /DNA_START=74 /DNA_END=1576 /DNA_ORIENTATION=+